MAWSLMLNCSPRLMRSMMSSISASRSAPRVTSSFWKKSRLSKISASSLESWCASLLAVKSGRAVPSSSVPAGPLLGTSVSMDTGDGSGLLAVSVTESAGSTVFVSVSTAGSSTAGTAAGSLVSTVGTAGSSICSSGVAAMTSSVGAVLVTSSDADATASSLAFFLGRFFAADFFGVGCSSSTASVVSGAGS